MSEPRINIGPDAHERALHHIAELEKQCEWYLKLFLPEDLVQSKNGTWRIDTPEGWVDAPDWLVSAMKARK